MILIFSNFDDLPLMFDVPEDYVHIEELKSVNNLVVNADDITEEQADILSELANLVFEIQHHRDTPNKYCKLRDYLVTDAVNCGWMG